jgi:FkbM family methyltransferase
MFVNLLQRIVRRLRRYIFSPRVGIKRLPNMIRMGTSYGGWEFIDHPRLGSAPIVSAGLGEDASFDVEFASRYRGKVVIIDPTPRAIMHFHELLSRLGRKAETKYVPGGKQPIESYGLDGLTSENFELVEKALWSSETTVKFFQPPNPAHVSYSVTNFQNNYSRETAFIEVPTTTLKALMQSHGIDQLELIKLDIEGAETEVIYDMLKNGILPNQILVEFDELSIPSAESKAKFEACDQALRQNGYVCIYWNGRADFAYAHDSLLRQLGAALAI